MTSFSRPPNAPWTSTSHKAKRPASSETYASSWTGENGKPRFFAHQWTQRERKGKRGRKLAAARSRFFSADNVTTGDRVYIVGVDAGSLIIGGRILVKELQPADDGTELAIAQDPCESYREHIVPLAVAEGLRFASRKADLKIVNGRVDGQTLRRLRELTAGSAETLDAILDA